MNDGLAWHFQSETSIPSDVVSLLIDGEEPHKAYKTVRDKRYSQISVSLSWTHKE